MPYQRSLYLQAYESFQR